MGCRVKGGRRLPSVKGTREKPTSAGKKFGQLLEKKTGGDLRLDENPLLESAYDKAKRNLGKNFAPAPQKKKKKDQTLWGEKGTEGVGEPSAIPPNRTATGQSVTGGS